MGRYGSPAPHGLPGSALPGINGRGSLLTGNNWFPYGGIVNGADKLLDQFPPSQPPELHLRCLRFSARPPDLRSGRSRSGRPSLVHFHGRTDRQRPLRHRPHAQCRRMPSTSPSRPDNPFGVAELERILRYYDRDAATLPQRLANLTRSSGASSAFAVAAGGNHAPKAGNVPVLPACCRPTLAAAIRSPNKRSLHPVDILSAKVPAETRNHQRHEDAIAPLGDLARPEDGPQPALRVQGPSRRHATGALMLRADRQPLPDQPGTAGENVQQITSAGGRSRYGAVQLRGRCGLVSQVNGVRR